MTDKERDAVVAHFPEGSVGEALGRSLAGLPPGEVEVGEVPEASDYAKWQHAENVLDGYRARVLEQGYKPPGSPGSAREFSYRAGWRVACFDLVTYQLRKLGLQCKVRGEEQVDQLYLVGVRGSSRRNCGR
jgi:hypothetical protein